MSALPIRMVPPISFPLDAIRLFIDGYHRLRFLTINGQCPTHLVATDGDQWFVWDHQLTRSGPYKSLIQAVKSVRGQVPYERKDELRL